MSTLRDDLNAALDATPDQDYDETQQEIVTDEEVGTDELDTTDDTADSADDQTDTDVSTSDSDDTTVEPDAVADAGDTKKPKELKPGDSIKAPVNWGPKEREDWSRIPRHLQDKIMSRERDISNLLNETTEARRTHEEFNRLATTYGAALSGVAGNTPMEAVNNLFSTVSNLRMGTAEQKAQIIAGMINDFGVDINTLDSTLAGVAAPEQQQNAALERMLNEKLAPFEAMMGQQNAYQQQQQQQMQQKAVSDVQAFAQDAEFIQDVRKDMADLIDMAAERGQEMTLQEAYDKACLLNPQIQEVLAQRQEAERITGQQQNLGAKKLAASSITGRQVGGGGEPGDMSIRDAISTAWDAQNKI